MGMRRTNREKVRQMKIGTMVGILLLFVFIIAPVLADKPNAEQSPGGSGSSLKVTLTGIPHWTTTYGWTIDKSVDSDLLEMMEGSSGTSFYTIAVSRDGGTEKAWVEGEVCVANKPNRATEGLAIQVDLVEDHSRHPRKGGGHT